jgi:poly(3-hydroxybutyrate) depolymerase
LTVPERCTESGCGLIVDIHGGTMSGAMEEKNTRLAELGPARGYIVLQPNAIVRLLYSGDVLPQWVPELDDSLVIGFIEDVIQAYRVDRTRVHITGFSQGSLMTWRLICARADLFASAAPAHGSHPDVAKEDCSFTGANEPARELPILALHGRYDEFSTLEQALVKRDAVRKAFEMDEGTLIAGDDHYTHTRYSNPRGVVFEFLIHDYQTDAQATFGPWHEELKGHCFPGSTDHATTLPGQVLPFACTPPNAFVWGELALRFFEAHPLGR